MGGIDAPLPASLLAGGRSAGCTVIGAEDASGVEAGNLDINGIRLRNGP